MNQKLLNIKFLNYFDESNNFKFLLRNLFLMLLFCSSGNLFSQTTLINPTAEGGFNLGNTFAANGWTVANEGTGNIKWALGTAASGITVTGATTSGSATITLAAANPAILPGQYAYAFNIPTNAFVVSVSGTSVTLSQNVTTTESSMTIGFGKDPGSVNVNARQLTNTSIAAGSFTITLAAANPNIAAGMLISPIANVIAPGTYVSSVSGTSLRLSKATINSATVTTAQTLDFTSNGSAITGNAAYITNNNGVTNSYGGNSTNRTVYLYRDITNAPASEKAMTLTFDVKSPAATTSAGWQVWVAPISQSVIGTNTQVTVPGTYGLNWPGATMIAFAAEPQVSATKMTAFIPKQFAGTSFRLIFVWTNNTGSGTLQPVAIDNISLTSRAAEEIIAAQSGLWSMASTWDGGKVPTHADTVVLDGSESVIVDTRYTGCEDLILAGANALLQFGFSTVVDEFTIYNDLNVAASGARFNNHDGTNGKHLKLGHNLDVGSGGRFDSNFGSTTAFTGRLTLNGSTVQNITVDSAGFFGGSVLQSQTAASTNANQVGVLNQLDINNTATATSNVIWNVPITRIKSNLFLTNARVNVTIGNRFVIGNFGGLLQTALVVNPGSGFTNGLISKWLSSASTFIVNPGTEYPGLDNNFNPYRYPFISAGGTDRTFYFLPDGNAATAGEVAVSYSDSNTVTAGLTIADGSYSINNRFEGNYTVSTPNASATPIAITFTPNATTPTFRIGAYLNGGFEALDGTARFMNQSVALGGTHQDGTSQPFVFRTELSLSNLTAAPLFVGIKNTSLITTGGSIVSAGSGDWNTATTWVGGVVPSCLDSVSIASGHTVTVTTTANVANVVIASGGTLVNNSTTNNMTVGCTNNTAAFTNNGTHTMTSGKLLVNGFVAHKAGSTFNQTGGEIIVDSNNNGDAATSVPYGGASFKIDSSNLNLTDGKITIVDPLVSLPLTATTALSVGDFIVNTAGSTGFFTLNGTATAASTSITGVGNYNLFEVGQEVSGTNIAAGTAITAISTNFFTGAVTLTISQPVTAAFTAQPLNFSSMKNGGSTIVLEANTANSNLGIGQIVSGNGIPVGATITGIIIGGLISGPTSAFLTKVTISQPISGLTTSPIAAQEAISITAVSPGAYSTVLTAANTAIKEGMLVTGTGIVPGTFVTAVNGASVSLSQPIQSGAPSPLSLSFNYSNTLTSGSFIYNSPTHYAAGLNHTLQIGDGISTQNTPIITNGFNCQFQAGGGLFSMGNFTIDAPNGAERYVTVSSNNLNNRFYMNVQNTFTVNEGSVFKKTHANSTIYLGGNVINNGIISTPWQGTGLYLGNLINGVASPTTIAQTLSGTGTWQTKEWSLSSGPTSGYSAWNLNVNNTSPNGVTLEIPNFKLWSSVTLVNGILNTSDTYPIYCGIEDVVSSPFFGGNYNVTNISDSTYINGPCIHANQSSGTITQYRLFPVGKNGKYTPIFIASTGGVQLKAEAFSTNTGTVNTTNASNLSQERWKLTRVGTAGAFTEYNVRLGATQITGANIIVHSATENGVYDIVSSPASSAMTFTAGTPNTITLGTSQTGGFLGNFAYAEGPACSGTPTPGATVASSTSFCNGQSVILSLATATIGTGVTYQWQSSIDGGTTWNNVSMATSSTYLASPSVATSYQCIVTCSGNSGTSTPVAITPEISTAVVPNVATACDANTVTLSATGASLYNWYDATTGGNLVATGTSFSPTLTATTNYYVASVTETASNINTAAFAGTTAGTTLFAGITFDVTKPIKLKTVRVYPKNTASGLTPITINLYDGSGNIVTGTSSVTFIPSLNTGTVGTVSQDVTLNYNIPTGIGYRLVVSNGVLATTNNSLGNSTATITYPNGTTLVLKGNVSSLTATPTTTTGTTYFHNLTFDEICEAVVRTSVTATKNTSPAVPTVTTTAATCAAAGNATVSNYDATLTYVFTPSGPTVGAGGAITGATAGTSYTVTAGNGTCTSVASASFATAAQFATPPAPTGNATQTIIVSQLSEATIEDLVVSGSNGNWYASEANALATTNALAVGTQLVSGTTYYTVNVSSNGCVSAVFAVTVTVTLSTDLFTLSNLKYYPNPVSNQLTIASDDEINSVEVYNLLGQFVKRVAIKSTEINIEFNDLPSGTYLLKVSSENKSENFKVIKK